MKIAVILALNSPAVAFAASSGPRDQCKDVKEFYKDNSCCGAPETRTYHQIIPIKGSSNIFDGLANPCDGKKVQLDNTNCFSQGVAAALEQAGADVTKNKQGTLDSNGVNATKKQYWQVAMCPVNVHWHIGTEHRSEGEYDESFNDKGPDDSGTSKQRGFRCGHYKSDEEKFTKPYKWKYCTNMSVGETYEVHWPHSALGACGTTNQYQSPFYDGVFCNYNSTLHDLSDKAFLAAGVGVQGQVFTVVNDEDYYYPDLIRGMIMEGDYGKEITYYTGSTTGDSRSNSMCSSYAPITWQVDRTCHLISASSFDKMCADMLAQKDDMSSDVHPHGARELVWSNLTADNQHHGRRLGHDGFQIHAMEYA